MTEEVRVRVSRPEDVKVIAQLAAGFADAPRWPANAWAKYAAANTETAVNRALLIAENGPGAMAGWIAGTWLAQTAETETMFVLPAWRRHGLGTKLLGAWLRLMRERIAQECSLEVRASNEAALRLYRNAGFLEVGRRTNYYCEPREDGLLLRLSL